VDGICAPRRRGRRARGASAARGLPVAPDDRLEAVAAAALPDGRDERARFVIQGRGDGPPLPWGTGRGIRRSITGDGRNETTRLQKRVAGYFVVDTGRLFCRIGP